MSEVESKKKVVIDLNYLQPDTTFVYPLYSPQGEKILEKKQVLTETLIKDIIKKNGSRVFYYFKDYEAGLIPEILLGKAFSDTRDMIKNSIRNGKLSQGAFDKSEELVEEILSEISDKELSAINLLKDMKKYDNYLYAHAVNVGILSALLVKKLRKYSRNEIKYVVLGAYLADLGKIKIDDEILNKPTKLSEKEILTMQRHPQIGYDMLKNLQGIDPIVFQTVLFHHERFDDEGYYSLPYESLPSSPKIVAICDTYDALTTMKPYRQSYSPAEALKIMVNLIDYKFDRKLVSDFINHMGKSLNHCQNFYRKGDFCILSTSEIALITVPGSVDLLKPRVMIFASYEKKEKVTMRFFDNPIEVNLMVDLNRELQNIITNQVSINAIRKKLLSKKMLVDYLYSGISND